MNAVGDILRMWRIATGLELTDEQQVAFRQRPELRSLCEQDAQDLFDAACALLGELGQSKPLKLAAWLERTRIVREARAKPLAKARQQVRRPATRPTRIQRERRVMSDLELQRRMGPVQRYDDST